MNKNCLEGFSCPACGYEDRFFISAVSSFTMTDSGDDGHGDVEWGDTSACTCCSCGKSGVVKDFREAGAS